MNYLYKGREYSDLYALGKDMYLFSDDMAKELRQDSLLQFVDSKDQEKSNQLKKLSLLSLPDDIFVFKASYIFNPYMSLRIKGFCFNDYVSLGKTMLSFSPEADSTLLELVHYQLVSQQMLSSGFAKENPSIYQKVKEIEQIADNRISYFSMGYFLSKKKTIIFNGYEYQSIYDLTYFLCKKEKDLSTLGDYLSLSPLLEVYSEYAPNSQDVKKYLHLCSELDKNEKALKDFLARKQDGLNADHEK
jgi:hypothetical protein